MKSRFFIPATALVASCALTLSVSAEEKSILLKQTLPVGKKVYQSMSINQKMKMAGAPGAPAGGMNITNKMIMDMSMDISKHEESKKKMVLKYETLSMNLDAGVFQQEMSSEDKDSPFGNVAGKPITLIYDENSKVESVEGTEDLIGDAEGVPGAGEMLTQLLSEEQLKNTMDQMMVQGIPKTPVKVGDSWDHTMDMPMPQGMGKMKMKAKYTLKKFDKYEGHDCAVLGMEGEIISDGKTKVEMQGTEMEMDFKDSQFEADIYFDNKLGLARKTDMLTMMKMDIGMAAVGLNMSMDMNMTMTAKVTKVEESK